MKKKCDVIIDDKVNKISKYDYKLFIDGLDCPNCALKLEKELKKIDFIEDCSINFMNGYILVKLLKKVPIKKVVDEFNLVCDKIEPEAQVHYKKNNEFGSDRNETIFLFIIFIVFIIMFLIDHFVMEINNLILILLYLIVAFDILKVAIKNLLNGKLFDENFLMSIATFGALYVGSYFEGIAVMLFYRIGELLQKKAIYKSKKSIESLASLQVNECMLEDKTIVTVESVNIGDTILIKPGERVPLDGILLSEDALLDLSMLNGESIPVRVVEQEEILSGSINLNKLIKIKVTTTNENSTLQKIMNLVEEASDKKSTIENFITKFAKVYTPIICLLACLFLLSMCFINGLDNFNIYLKEACTFLVISCPCALVVSIPLGIFAAIGKASRIGAVVKGGNYLEYLQKIDTVIFDKTGTLTNGNFSVVEYTNMETLKLAAIAEKYSNHPIAKAISSAYNEKSDNIEEIEELAGLGIKAIYKDETLLVGNYELMHKNNIEIVDENNIVGTTVYVGYKGKYVGKILVADIIKENSLKLINALNKNNISTIMLSGDNSSIVNDVKEKLNIDVAYGDLLPADKIKYVEEQLNKGKNVMFVGDGINDAPSIVRADIGVSIGGIGSDVAIEASDIILINNDIYIIYDLLKLSKKTKKINYQNIIFSLMIKFIILITTAFGITNMWLGVFADVGVTLIAIFNALRLLK